ncbi:MAG: glycosyltransferase family 2 protein [Clostridium sp.]|nr:glycosyltransferase family 2 protein [Clostridium sp.]MCM1173248.1 glycosyltransferase family 2 protein [Clostridium sp.]MCM1208350.1 glycosyltransferase family 2 protein [Ruminococcus sp.]
MNDMETKNKFRYKHCFSISAYKESPYLESCIKSLMAQTVRTRIIMCTSTPNSLISSLAEKYNIRLYVRNGASDIRSNWNYAYNMADSEYVTVVHQDDIYGKRYVEKFFQCLSKYEKSGAGKKVPVSIFFSDYRPIKNGRVGDRDINCRLRRLLRLPLKNVHLAGNKLVKKAILSLGNSISCPSVAYNKSVLGDSIFTSDLQFNIDWDTFLKLGAVKGAFLYCDYPLIGYRIHENAISKEFIDNRKRYDEDMIMFQKIWHEKIARFIMRFYVKAYDTYKE